MVFIGDDICLIAVCYFNQMYSTPSANVMLAKSEENERGKRGFGEWRCR